MISEETKKKLLAELEKVDIVSVACQKAGCGRATFYRHVEKDKKFAKEVTHARKIGREGICDIGEFGLVQLAREGHFPAIRYMLGHNSPRYKRQDANVIFQYKGSKKEVEPTDAIDSLAELIKLADRQDKKGDPHLEPRGVRRRRHQLITNAI